MGNQVQSMKTERGSKQTYPNYWKALLAKPSKAGNNHGFFKVRQYIISTHLLCALLYPSPQCGFWNLNYYQVRLVEK